MSDPSAYISLERIPEVVGADPIVELSTDARFTTTRSVRKRLDLTEPVPIVPCVEVTDRDGTLTRENTYQYWSSITPAAWSYMLAPRSRGLGATRTGGDDNG